MSNIFQQASRLKLRFQTSKGFLNTEQLWDLSLTSLDQLYISLKEQLGTSSTEGLIKNSTTTKEDAELTLKLNILVEVFNTLTKEKEAKEKQKAIQSQNARIDDLIARKEDEQLANMSIEELQKLRKK